MQWHVAMLAALFLGWCGSSMTSPIDNDRALPLNVWNLQPLELQWDAETAPEPMHNSRLSAYYDASWPVDVKGNGRWKRGEPNISIMAPLDVLRHRLWQEMRRRAEMQIKENKKMMESVGKRKKRNSSLSDPALPPHFNQFEFDDAETVPQWAKRV